MTSVNSPLKPPTQNANKDIPSNNGAAGRRTSLSQAQVAMNTFATNSPSSRPGARRRESSDMIQSSQLTSPTGNTKFSKEDTNISSPPPSLLRRRTDFREGVFGPNVDEKDGDKNRTGLQSDSTIPFGPLKRTATGPPGPSSAWSGAPQSAGFSPMGAFGNFSLSGAAGPNYSPIDKKPTFGSLRGESRFKGLMGTDNQEESKSKVSEKASATGLEQLTEATNEQPSTWAADRVEQPQGDEKFTTGSAALGGEDASPPRQPLARMRNADRQLSYDDIGFSSLGLSSDIAPFREALPRRDFSQIPAQPQGQNILQMNEPMSPTNTNPYQSPEGEKALPEDFDADDSDPHNTQPVSTRPFNLHPRGFQTHQEGNTSDRSQTSSVGAGRSYPSLSALGTMSAGGATGAWPNVPGAIGTPTRALPGFSGGFGDSGFGPLGDLNSSGHTHGGAGPNFLGGAPPVIAGNVGSVTRGSKMGSLFPNAMQDQMVGEPRHERGFGEGTELYQRHNPAVNASSFGTVLRETDSPARPGRGMLDDLFGNLDSRGRNTQGLNPAFGANESGQPIASQIPTSQGPFPAVTTIVGGPSMTAPSGGSYLSRAQDQDTSAAPSNQMPASQQRQMVMPDRMRWIYRDPQGNTQGPWSGLEMHDWYKAGFFSPELQVKKCEDADYEPLAQLIRRIGNSREPFLVPQIGIPHGSAAAPAVMGNVSGSGNVSATTPSAIQSSSAQPPFASSFPSFGTTLTAEQQNALERRKQEEQYLMARQKEHLAQQQVLIKQMQHMQGGSHVLHGQQLHHHSSAHSLQSQPSYGSITSPTGYQPPPTQGSVQPPPNVPGFFDALARNSAHNLGPLGGSSETLGSVREDEATGMIDRLNTGRGGQLPFGGPSYNAGQQEVLNHSQQVSAMLQERARLQREQEHYDVLHRASDDHRGTADRLEQFNILRGQVDEHSQVSQKTSQGSHTTRPLSDVDRPGQQHGHDSVVDLGNRAQAGSDIQKSPERLSLSEQVQKAAALAQPQSPWAKVDSGLPQPFPPPQSSSPLPAPAAQRSRQNVADALAAESQSRSQTPSVETPSATVAPWAKDNTDGPKGPSLKEIQATEARKAAQQEELAAAARRAIAEQERQNQVQPAAPAPGLPSSANWASGVSPATPIANGPSAWAKPAAGKTPVASATNAKKTLAQIQREEEARKIRVAAAASAAASTISNPSPASSNPGGKRYADLAGKAALTTSNIPNSAWTTVGAGGKPKTPTTGPAPVLTARNTSGGSVQPLNPVVKPKLTTPARGTLGGSVSNQQAANDEFHKWTKSALAKGLNAGIPG